MLRARIDRTWDGQAAATSESVNLIVRRQGLGLILDVDAPYHGDPLPRVQAGRCNRLWEFEVVEFFLVGPGDRYLELEFGPGGHWLALGFAGVRNVVDPAIAIRYRATLEEPRWSAQARVDAVHLPPRPWRWNAFAIHGTGAQRRYLAAHAVPGPQPDFHRPERFPEVDPRF